MFLVAYFGRPTLGVLTNLFPLHDGLLFHRFDGGVCLAAIVLIGVGGAVIWQLFRPHSSMLRLGAAVVVMLVLLAPAVSERMTFYSFNTAFQQRSMDALQSNADANAILQRLKALPSGRIYAGQASDYGDQMSMQDLRFSSLLPFNDLPDLTATTSSSLNSDYVWDFDYKNQGDFDLFNVRYMVAPSGLDVPSFLTPLLQTGRYTLYEAPTTGYAEYVAITTRQAVATQAELFDINLAWERTHTLPGERLYMRYDYPATAQGSGPSSGAACPGGGKTDFEMLQSNRMDFVVECPVDSTLVIKSTYPPNWQVSVDGVVVPDFMVSPSYIGISLPAGKHTVNAVYRPSPIKASLLVVGIIAALLLLILRGRLDRFAERLRFPRRKRGRASGGER
jgi:hypothetical protein